MRVSRWAIVVATALAVAIGISSCAPPTPLVPQSLVTSIQDDGREYTYDVAWQNTRLVVDIIEREAFDELEHVALPLVARLHRLEKARAEDMSDRATAKRVSDLEQLVFSRSQTDNLIALTARANAALVSFDEGDFSKAKHSALEVLVIARWLSHQQ